MEEPGGLQSMGSQRVRHNLATKQQQTTILLLFYAFFFFQPWGTWYLSSLTKDQTQAPRTGRWSLNHWTAREVQWYFLKLYFNIFLCSCRLNIYQELLILIVCLFIFLYINKAKVYKEGWAPKNWCFRTVVLEKTLESPLDSKKIKPINPKGNQPWICIGRTDAEAPIVWSPDVKSQLTGKDLDDGKDGKPGMLQPTGSKRVRHDSVTEQWTIKSQYQKD